MNMIMRRVITCSGLFELSVNLGRSQTTINTISRPRFCWASSKAVSVKSKITFSPNGQCQDKQEISRWNPALQRKAAHKAKSWFVSDRYNMYCNDLVLQVKYVELLQTNRKPLTAKLVVAERFNMQAADRFQTLPRLNQNQTKRERLSNIGGVKKTSTC